MRSLAGIVLIAHAIVHLNVWFASGAIASGFDPRRSWIAVRAGAESQGRAASKVLGASAAGLLAAAGAGVIADATWGPGLAVAGAAVSLLLTVAFFNVWLSVNVLINLVIIYLATR